APTPGDPAAIAASQALLTDARDCVRDAVLATMHAGGIDPLAPYWTHRATIDMGRADGLIQAVVGMQRLSRVPIPGVMYRDTLEAARMLVADAAELSARGGDRTRALALVGEANARLQRLDGQFAFDIAKHEKAASGG
ncbi:MAG: hypothetical protein KDC46_11320, partial [Thermoleophilia bacterium]|nr:hypothetical protein [Thermoleophilia bacterium]